MKRWIGVLAVIGVLLAPDVAPAQPAREVFEKVAPSVVVIKARGHDDPFEGTILRAGDVLELTGRAR